MKRKDLENHLKKESNLEVNLEAKVQEVAGDL